MVVVSKHREPTTRIRQNQMTTLMHARKTLAALCASIVIFLFPLWLYCGSGSSFFYFNPDSPQSNMSRLKEAMDSLLTFAKIPLSFQPFTRMTDFDRQVRDAAPDFLLLPQWYLKQDGNGQRYAPLLAPVRKGNTTYRKVLLVARDSSLTVEELAKETIAMTPVGAAGLEDLNAVLFTRNGLDAGRLNFITTTKDSDALFALALHQVKAALVSEDNLAHFGAINPRILETVKELAVSDPISLPLLCYNRQAADPAAVEKIKKLFLNGKVDGTTAKIMEMLQIDAWQEID